MGDYNKLKDLGFFCYCSNKQGDLFRSNKKAFKGIKIIGTYKGFTLNVGFNYYENIDFNELKKVLLVNGEEVKIKWKKIKA